MNNIYGNFSREQFSAFKSKLHSKIHWLLLYKDPKLQGDFDHVDYNLYFDNFLKELDGLNDLLMHPPALIELMAKLMTAYNETKADNFDFSKYRKFIFDAQTILDTLGEGDS